MSEKKTPEQVIADHSSAPWSGGAICYCGEEFASFEAWSVHVVEALRANRIELIRTSNITRVTVVAPDYGVAFEKYGLYAGGVTLMTQDDDRTLKIFPLAAARATEVS